jgi:U3 small nucleolar RNA-associated protein 10
MLDAAGAITGSNALSSEDMQLQIMSLHCLASMIEVLREEFISLLPVAIPRIFDLLRSSISGREDLLHEAAYALLCAIAEHLTFVFSGQYFAQSLEISQASATANLTETSRESRRHFHILSAKLVDARRLFAAIEQTWRSAFLSGPEVCFSMIARHLIICLYLRAP